jgi:hypothetical protein
MASGQANGAVRLDRVRSEHAVLNVHVHVSTEMAPLVSPCLTKVVFTSARKWAHLSVSYNNGRLKLSSLNPNR